MPARQLTQDERATPRFALDERWPGICIDSRRLARALHERGIASDDPCAVEVALAIALAEGDRVALAVFDREISPRVREAVARFGRGDDFVSEIVQQTWIKLLLGDRGRSPRILDYRGRGRLVSWIQVVAIREALMTIRTLKRELPTDQELERLAFTDVQFERWREAHRRELSRAFGVAMAELEPRERELLQACFVDGIAGDQLAARYGVHRVTAFRWLRAARKKLRDRTRALFLERVRVADSEVDSVIRELTSSLSVEWE